MFQRPHKFVYTKEENCPLFQIFFYIIPIFLISFAIFILVIVLNFLINKLQFRQLIFDPCACPVMSGLTVGLSELTVANRVIDQCGGSPGLLLLYIYWLSTSIQIARLTFNTNSAVIKSHNHHPFLLFIVCYRSKHLSLTVY